MSETPTATRVTLDEAFTAVRHALTAQREAGYRTGRSISPTAHDQDLLVAHEANRTADALTAKAWQALYSAVASATWDQPIPYLLANPEEVAANLDEVDGHRHVDVGNGPYCLDCDQATNFCPAGAR